MINVDKMMPPKQTNKRSLRVEKPIGRNGTWRLAQKVRREIHYQEYCWDIKHNRAYKWAQIVIKTEMQLCATVQRELFVKEEIKKVHMSSIERDEKQLQKALYIAQSSCDAKEPAREGYSSLREKPGWHLKSKWLREDCANRGGCCGRQCKCCERPPDSRRMKGWGHCTVECACCYRQRGFELQDTDRRLFQPEFDVSRRPMSQYSGAIFRAYIWALE
ncbi:unnamed protein product [Penicillium camemberti]|uniref:Str. FM013 n=1 Tax=Penicillium camemberti (strain FM 013) TaxID=1429867 RepID=A0A0G4PFD7_PENC3|nr:unnamed protein product [Penicillium camemberti]